jgi:8-oxo-dGTP pyrophosphatase MutT (NUDIX family)
MMILLLSLILIFAAVFVLTKILLSSPKSKTTHGGGVLLKKVEHKSVVLLVSSKKTGEWVLPKGHIDQGETAEETAVREVKEETGYIGKIISYLGETPRYTFNNENILVAYYLMSPTNDEPLPAEQRKKEWVEIERAIEMVKNGDLKNLLRKVSNTV